MSVTGGSKATPIHEVRTEEQWFNPEWQATYGPFPLKDEGLALRYFEQSSFATVGNLNHCAREQGMDPLDPTVIQRLMHPSSGIFYTIEYAQPPHLFVISKKFRFAPGPLDHSNVQVISYFHIINNNVMECPSLGQVLLSRINRISWDLKSSFRIMTKDFEPSAQTQRHARIREKQCKEREESARARCRLQGQVGRDDLGKGGEKGLHEQGGKNIGDDQGDEWQDVMDYGRDAKRQKLVGECGSAVDKDDLVNSESMRDASIKDPSLNIKPGGKTVTFAKDTGGEEMIGGTEQLEKKISKEDARGAERDVFGDESEEKSHGGVLTRPVYPAIRHLSKAEREMPFFMHKVLTSIINTYRFPEMPSEYLGLPKIQPPPKLEEIHPSDSDAT
uniref:Mediator of RNA polymerase II transcription subunit 6 n=1 Tax=Polytomella parva TaxID=51329 RepID=A0A7S0YK43_9CHLO|mmetsp:Transcript_30438/g.55581  ORF Transcript_30438/g.55581 Transcript_30438/m.55581 type:complete len:389 (+) Transcript_30438:84-1250(+)|eukprot:CAMPEP_0175039146 /NCGR_PEP_ID=MMETSP0052_2-20121109/359_1 /TAXON_ID=51329 ORGANISM="Polytomella parva, Strain SAG 63-3" /NCGR_SAMPLE_ID=MMETSP0052_2 /ASSEMBLY_ACC=CAM_ASM_000194 /LENGTH=388 /DNA_ID=CAMNT_0016300841 /DNA_START=31 /DNA_END=1197 /DNA_ORIENTATION=+